MFEGQKVEKILEAGMWFPENADFREFINSSVKGVIKSIAQKGHNDVTPLTKLIGAIPDTKVKMECFKVIEKKLPFIYDEKSKQLKMCKKRWSSFDWGYIDVFNVLEPKVYTNSDIKNASIIRLDKADITPNEFISLAIDIFILKRHQLSFEQVDYLIEILNRIKTSKLEHKVS